MPACNVIADKRFGATKISIPLFLVIIFTASSYCFVTDVVYTELDESMLDALGILPQRKQHKKLLLVCHDL